MDTRLQKLQYITTNRVTLCVSYFFFFFKFSPKTTVICRTLEFSLHSGTGCSFDLTVLLTASLFALTITIP